MSIAMATYGARQRIAGGVIIKREQFDDFQISMEDAQGVEVEIIETGVVSVEITMDELSVEIEQTGDVDIEVNPTDLEIDFE